MNLKKYEELRKKAESGDAQAMLEYSEYLQKYHGLQEAHEWHTKAAKAGNPRAMAEEGNFILYGWVEGTLEEALEYYKKESWWKNRKIIKKIDSEEFRKGIDGCKKLDLIRDFYN